VHTLWSLRQQRRLVSASVSRAETPPSFCQQFARLPETQRVDAGKVGGKGGTAPGVHQRFGARGRNGISRYFGAHRQSVERAGDRFMQRVLAKSKGTPDRVAASRFFSWEACSSVTKCLIAPQFEGGASKSPVSGRRTGILLQKRRLHGCARGFGFIFGVYGSLNAVFASKSAFYRGADAVFASFLASVGGKTRILFRFSRLPRGKRQFASVFVGRSAENCPAKASTQFKLCPFYGTRRD